jgi:dTDP-glucose pyrophosphorylase
MANIIPMAGLGSRFTNEGYTLPKALIPVSGVPMIIKVIRDMPKSDKWVFVVRKEHIDDFRIDSLIKSELPNAIIVPVEKTTEGQACTCMLAMEYVEENEPVFIAACDNGYIYDKKRYDSIVKRKDIDCIVWTFTKRETLRNNPQAWGWCKLEEDGMTIKDMSVKVPISEDPYNDHAVVATFFFKRAKDFIDATNLMIKENYRIKNEFYVDALPIFLKKLGKKAAIFDVDFYLGWGTPKDLYDYQKLEYFIKHNVPAKGISDENEKLLSSWKRYFKEKG